MIRVRNYNVIKLRLRKEQKLTQKELAKAINVAPSTIGDYEKRKHAFRDSIINGKGNERRP